MLFCSVVDSDPDPDPAFYLMRIRIQESKPMRIQADLNPDPGQTFESQKLNFYMKNILKFGNRSKNIHIVPRRLFIPALQ